MDERTTRIVRSPSEGNADKPMQQLGSILNETILETKERLNADRVSIFFFDREKCELWSILSQEKKIMRLDARLGVAGHVATTGKSINIADAYDHPLFYKDVDLETGYRTRTLLAVPLKNSKGEIVGVGEAINKAQGLFSDADGTLLQALAARVAYTIEATGIEPQLRDYALDGADRAFDRQFSTQQIVGMSHRIEAVVRLIDQIRGCCVDVLIQGENGTGKELVARALHATSPRAGKPFVALNCAALPDNLVEAELFGIEKGVATGVERRIGKFEAANGGTLFLDEIGDLSLGAQAKILRVLQERAVDRVGGSKPIPIDVRIVAATNKNFDAAFKERTFREDLYYRLKVILIQMPPLREIPEDIPAMANHFLAKHCNAMKVEPKQFTPSAMQALMGYSWPGNSRQLENEVKKLAASVRGKAIAEEHLDPSIRNPQAPVTIEQPAAMTVAAPAGQSTAARRQTLPAAVEALERQIIEATLRETHGNKQQAAQLMGLSRQGLIKKLKRLGTG
jgi:Nif-specific regulatory protein